MPDAEKILWSRLQRKQFFGYRFRRQYGISRYVVDFYCPKAKLVIELDGDSHFNDTAERYDKVREDYIKALGLRVVRFRNDETRKQLMEVLETILNALQCSLH